MCSVGEIMNIQLLTPKFLSYKKNNENFHSSTAMRSNLAGLNADTVTFSGKINTLQEASHNIGDAFKAGYEAKIPAYKVLAARLMDTMEATARELEDFGLIFDREYCSEEHMVKGVKSFISKLKRSGESPLDRVRGTWYLEKLHDLSIFSEHILPALEKRGYQIAAVPDRVSGRKILSYKPDFDVRLNNVTEKSKKSLPQPLRDVASFKEQASGYADIQFRLIDALDAAKEKTPLEVIIVAGKNTAQAKRDESYYVYDIVRALKKELQISKIANPAVNTPEQRVQNNIGIIEQQLNAHISRPLYTNAKNLDIYHDDSQLPVELSQATCKALTGLVEGMRQKTKLYYNARLREVASDDYKKVIEKMIKASSEYKERTDKTIYVEDILEKRNQLLKELRHNKREDLELISRVQTRLTETIEKYGKQD